MHHVLFSEQAKKQLFKLDKYTQLLITSWLKKNIDRCQDPRAHGKTLCANIRGKWRYRVGDYRIICHINENQLIVLAINIGHRREIYK